MIKKILIKGIEAEKDLDAKPTGFDVNFVFENIEIKEKEIKIDFLYEVNYKPALSGKIKIRGLLLAEEEKEKIKKIEEGMKNKKLPPEYAQEIINNLNYFSATYATIIATAINLFPPLQLQMLEIKK